MIRLWIAIALTTTLAIFLMVSKGKEVKRDTNWSFKHCTSNNQDCGKLE